MYSSLVQCYNYIGIYIQLREERRAWCGVIINALIQMLVSAELVINAT